MIKRVIKNSVLILLLSLSTKGFSFWQWTKMHTLDNGKRFEATGFSLSGKGYITCGVDTNDNCYNDLWEYDPVFNFWTQKANLPASYRRGAFGFELNNKGYIGGGCSDISNNFPLNDFWMYDPLTNSWVSKANLLTNTYRSAGVSCNNKGYMMGGASSWSPLHDVYEYNPSLNSWTYVAYTPDALNSSGGREGAVAVCINNKIYFGLGKDDSMFQNDWWEFNPTTYGFTVKASYPASGRTGAFGFSINGVGVVGMGSDGGYTADTWWYNATSDMWNYSCSFSGGGRRSAVAFAIGNYGYMGTGKSANGSKQDFYKLDATVGINEIEKVRTLFSVYPNPVIDKTICVNIEADLKGGSIIILNSLGQGLYSELITQSHLKLQPNDLPAGIYYISVLNKSQILSTQKIIVL